MLKTQGVTLCVSTGRMRAMLPEMAEDIGFDYILSSNGASCYEVASGKELFHIHMTTAQAQMIWDAIKPYDCMTEWFVNGDLLMDQRNFEQWEERLHAVWHRKHLAAGKGRVIKDIQSFIDEGAPGLEKAGVMQFPKEKYQEIIGPLLDSGLFEISSSLGSNFEITDIKANKGTALTRLCKCLNIDPAQAIAFGDGTNDIAMLQAAGVGVAMGNSMDEVRAQAKIFTLTNEEDGVADYLWKHVIK